MYSTLTNIEPGLKQFFFGHPIRHSVLKIQIGYNPVTVLIIYLLKFLSHIKPDKPAGPIGSTFFVQSKARPFQPVLSTLESLFGI